MQSMFKFTNVFEIITYYKIGAYHARTTHPSRSQMQDTLQEANLLNVEVARTYLQQKCKIRIT